MDNEAAVIRVAASSHPAEVAGAIAGMVRNGKEPTIRAIGAAAVNQAVKAIAVARTYLEPEGVGLAFVPSFFDTEINGEERTGLRFVIETRPCEPEE